MAISAPTTAPTRMYNVTNGERYFNDLLSNAYTNTFSYHRGGAGFRINRKGWNGGFRPRRTVGCAGRRG
ncbi:MAG: hypothetical protein IPK76_16075 [Lewinellaceae bacterium]|nr:hypothetical protein [Lewinellaceae bacterium]